MDKHTYYAIKRKYHSILTFHDHQFWDLKQDNAWEFHGDQIWTFSDKAYNIKMYDDKWCARFDQDKSVFNGILDCHPRNNCMTVLTTGGYLQHRTPIAIENNFFSIGCWIRIRAVNATQYINSPNYEIVLCGWDDAEENGTHVQLIVASSTGDHDACKIRYRTSGPGGTTVTTHQKEYQEPGPIYTPATWHYFTFTHGEGYDRIYLDGKKVLENDTIKNNCMISNELHRFRLGAYTDYCSGGLDIDEFVIVNDFFGIDEFEVHKDRRIYWTYPEMLHEEELDLGDSIYYKTGSMFGIHYVQLKPVSQSGSTLTFDMEPNDKILGLFINNTYMDPSRWSGTSTVTLSLASDKALISSATFTLVVIRPNSDDFFLDIRKVTASGNSFALPYIAGKTSKDDFIILDGSLGIVQRDKYRVEGSGSSYTVKLNNPHETFGGGGTNLHIIFLRKNSGTDPNIKFLELQGSADPQGHCKFPPEFNYIGYSKRNIILFVNGTYMPPDSYEIRNGVVTLVNDTENLHPANNVTALFMISSEKMDLDDEMLNRINGASEWNAILDDLRITRPTSWKEPENDYAGMYNKIQWYKNNKIPGCNFMYIDEAGIKFKE